MKQISHIAIISLCLLSIISHTSARLLSTHHQDDNPDIKPIQKSSLAEDDFSSLMGLEECGDKDEECQQRRMIAEAHLDYIYTQHHKP